MVIPCEFRDIKHDNLLYLAVDNPFNDNLNNWHSIKSIDVAKVLLYVVSGLKSVYITESQHIISSVLVIDEAVKGNNFYSRGYKCFHRGDTFEINEYFLPANGLELKPSLSVIVPLMDTQGCTFWS
jgi:hypothetical protein